MSRAGKPAVVPTLKNDTLDAVKGDVVLQVWNLLHRDAAPPVMPLPILHACRWHTPHHYATFFAPSVTQYHPWHSDLHSNSPAPTLATSPAPTPDAQDLAGLYPLSSLRPICAVL